MDNTLHEAQRLEVSGRRFVAAAILAGIVVVASTWFGLFIFLGANAAHGTLEDLREQWIPDVRAMSLDLPDLSRLSEVFTADGVLLGKLTERNSQPVAFDDIPPLVIGAVLSAEDRNFMTHSGVDYRAVARAFLRDIGGGPTEGGSTVSQQVVKLNFIGSEPTLQRKVAEAAIAIELERRYTKEQILEFYLNSVFFGNNAYGVKAAAQEYFGKELDQLTIAEAAAITVPIRNPSLYDLRSDSTIPVRARNAVIDNMVADGYISEEEGEAAKNEPIVVVRASGVPRPGSAGADRGTRHDPQRPRLRARCDVPAAQAGAVRMPGRRHRVRRRRRPQGVHHGRLPTPGGGTAHPPGVVPTRERRSHGRHRHGRQPHGGDDRDGVGPRFRDRPRRRPAAVRPGDEGPAQPGLGLQAVRRHRRPRAGLHPELVVGSDHPPGARLRRDRTVETAPTPAPTRRASAPWRAPSSRRPTRCFCQVAIAVGGEAIVDVAHRMGIRSPLLPIPAIVLGAQAVSPLEMAAAFSTMANYGERVGNYLIERIEDADGNIVYQHEVQRTPVLAPPLAAAIVNTLRLAVTRGTGGNANIGIPMAGKTGTHENFTDAWFVGFVPRYTTSVWVGFPDRQVEMRNLTVKGTFYARVFGSSLPAPIWREFMTLVTADMEPEPFPEFPEGTGSYYATMRVEIPDVEEMDLEEATDTLYKAGLDFTVTPVNSDLPKDHAVGTTPPAGTRVNQGITIELLVSTGLAPETSMPDLVGRTRAQVNSILTSLRSNTQISFTWVFVEVPAENASQDDRVASTNPPTGGTVDEDTEIEVSDLRLGRATRRAGRRLATSPRGRLVEEPAVLGTQPRPETAQLLLPEMGYPRGDRHRGRPPLDESLCDQHGEVDRLAHHSTVPSRCDEPEQIGDGAGPDDGGPEATNRRVRRVMAHPRIDAEERLDPPPRDDRGPRDRCCARGWRDFHLDGRTGISTDEPGRGNGHG
jgi:penicillin-binding protein 1A